MGTERAGVASTIIGARTLKQLEDNLAALDVKLKVQHEERLNALTAPGLNFPHDVVNNGRVFSSSGTTSVTTAEIRGFLIKRAIATELMPVAVRTKPLYSTYQMVKKLTKTGNSFALVLEKPILEKMKIDADTPLEVSTNGEVIVISPVRDRRRVAKLRAIVDRAHRDYSGVFARLAK